MTLPPIVSLQPINSREDLDRVGRWLHRPHVEQWWGDASTARETLRNTPRDNHRMIVAGTQAVGYLRWARVDSGALKAIGISGIPPGAMDADLFIGETEWLGRGVGPLALAELCAILSATLKPPLVGLCSSVDNRFAHRAFLKAGFSVHTVYDDPYYGRCFVFVRHL